MRYLGKRGRRSSGCHDEMKQALPFTLKGRLIMVLGLSTGICGVIVKGITYVEAFPGTPLQKR